MSLRILAVALASITLGLPVRAGEPSWKGKTVILVRPGVELQAPEGEKIAPKTAGVANDLMFQAQKDENGRLRISSRRQEGWIAKGDAVVFDQAVDYFTKKLAADPKADLEPDRVAQVAKIGENIKISRFHRLEVTGNGMVAAYIQKLDNNSIQFATERPSGSPFVSVGREIRILKPADDLAPFAKLPHEFVPALIAGHGELVPTLEPAGQVVADHVRGRRTRRAAGGRPEFRQRRGILAELRVVLGLGGVYGFDRL